MQNRDTAMRSVQRRTVHEQRYAGHDLRNHTNKAMSLDIHHSGMATRDDATPQQNVAGFRPKLPAARANSKFRFVPVLMKLFIASNDACAGTARVL